MSHISDTDSRSHFQLDRIILFSDAVFAIAITLLVIEIRVPAHEHAIEASVFDQYLHQLVPNLMGFLISFFLIGFYWTIHHRIFGPVVRYDATMLWLNLLLLLFIVLLPFSTSLLAEYNYLGRSYSLYYLNVGFVGIAVFLLQLHLNNPKFRLRATYESRIQNRFDSARVLTIPLIFFLGALCAGSGSPALLLVAKFIYLLIGPLTVVLKKIYKRRKTRAK